MTSSISLPSGRTISIDESTETVRFRAPSGACVLMVHMTDRGPVLAFAGAEIEIAADKLSLRAEQLSIAAGQLSIETREDLRMVAGRDLAVEARAGGVAIDANDDVEVRGERVRLNCDEPSMPSSWEQTISDMAPRAPARLVAARSDMVAMEEP